MLFEAYEKREERKWDTTSLMHSPVAHERELSPESKEPKVEVLTRETLQQRIEKRLKEEMNDNVKRDLAW